MILIVSNERDLTVDYVVLELDRRGVSYFRLNSEQLPAARLNYRPSEVHDSLEIKFPGRRIQVSEVSAAYFRRPGTPFISAAVRDPAELTYCKEEWASILRSLYSAIGDRWLNSPARIAIAEDKPLQLALASTVGLRTPETLITNDYAAATSFIKQGVTVGKPLHTALLDDPTGHSAERVIFTSRISDIHGYTAAAFEAAPFILQREIPKALDVRATVICTRIFAAAIHSQTRTETSTDWRRGSHPDLPHFVHKLPADIESKCATLVRRLGLRFAAIDLILDRDGNYWFLEANPNGQWAWIEHRTGLPISAAIVDELVLIASRSEHLESPILEPL